MRLGKYPMLNVLGTGSMGTLYRSLDPDTQRPVVLKTVRRDLLAAGDEDLRARLRAEAQAARGLMHPGIVAVYEYGEEGDWAYIAMEYVAGRTLQQCFDDGVAFSTARTVAIASQLLEALQYAHDHGVWHRDIKPANVLLTSTDRVKVTDFGIAQMTARAGGQPDPIMGTPGYVAPETYTTDTFDSRVDVFAAGAVVYQMLTGVPAYSGTPDKIMFKVCSETPTAPSRAANAPALGPFDAVLLRALARNPDERFATAAQFRAALVEAQGIRR